MTSPSFPLSGVSLRHLVFVAALLGLPLADARETLRLDAGWTFAAGDAPAIAQPVTLPHDWSIARPVDHAAPAAGHGGFFPTGTGEYQRVIAVPADWAGRRVALEFEGVAGLTDVSLNGVPLGRHVYAFTPFHVDLTPQLKAGADNLLVVRVDNSAQPAARWYFGSGLYRPVWLRVTDSVHVPAGGVFITTEELTADQARLRVHTEVGNAGTAAEDVTIETELLDPDGRPLATVRTAGRVPAAGEWTGSIDVVVPRPQAWSPESPRLHRAVTRILADGRVRDEVSTTFGIRTVRVSAERGFELNGRPLKLLGGNVHADTGPLGAAAFDRAEERKAELLQAAGFNAVRTAHNPPSTAFLAACDRLGLLVMDEIFDGWEKSKNPSDFGMHFKEWWQRDVDAWVRRDRHHASVVLWSTGNEMFERGNADGQRIARELAARIRASDPSRPVGAGVNGMGKSGEWSQLDPLFAAFDIAGYNYELTRHAADHVRLPARIIMAAESYQSEAFANWAAMQDNAYVIGDFVWSALDYLGEGGIGRVFPPGAEAKKHWEADMWPWHGAYCGDLDLTGWRKPVSHYRNIIWDRGEKLYAAVLVPPPGGGQWNVTPWSVPPALPTWTWPGQEGQPLTVEVYSRHEAVRLELNGRVLGEKPTTRAEEFKAVFTVPYAPGELKVTGLRGGRPGETLVLATAGETAALRLSADRTRLRAGGQDLAFVTVEALDARGQWQPQATPRVTFSVTGAGTLAAVGSGDLTSFDSYQGPERELYQGRALVVVRTSAAAGPITLTATAPGLPAAVLTLESAQP